MKSDVVKAKKVMHEGGYTCVVVNGELIHTRTERGVKPLLDWYDAGTDFNGFSAADKVVGKAAAFLYVLLGVRAVYAGVISKLSVELLQKHGIEVTYGTLVDAIRNRTNTGFCPMEQAVKDITSPNDAVDAIKNTLKKLSQSI